MLSISEKKEEAFSTITRRRTMKGLTMKRYLTNQSLAGDQPNIKVKKTNL